VEVARDDVLQTQGRQHRKPFYVRCVHTGVLATTVAGGEGSALFYIRGGGPHIREDGITMKAIIAPVALTCLVLQLVVAPLIIDSEPVSLLGSK
jgi:hypothetical protein